MDITLDWLGTATFRLKIGDVVLFLDTYMERVAAAPTVPLRLADVERADAILIGHSHFDHLGGADVIAKNTGATLIGSHETCRVMRERSVAPAQLLASSGGERHGLPGGVTVRVYPGVHSCTWILTNAPSGIVEQGHTGLTQEQRAQQHGLPQEVAAYIAAGGEGASDMAQHIRSTAGSRSDGGALVYLIETPAGSIFFQDSSGCWTGVLREIRADIAILAAAGRPNVDGEPNQGSQAQFIAMEASLLGAQTVILGHHDDWMPPITRPFDMSPVRDELARQAPGAKLIEQRYLDATRLFA